MRLKIFTGLALGAILIACGGEKPKQEPIKTTSTTEEVTTNEATEEVTEKVTEESVDVDFMSKKGVGPIKSMTLGEIDNVMVEKGKEIFKANCTACHKFEKRVVGPPLAGITQRRSPEWIMNMMLNPEVMVEKDPIAKELLAKYLSPMANQNLTEEEARAILELFRTKN